MRPEKWLNSREQLYIPSQNRCAFCDSDLDLIDAGPDPSDSQLCARAGLSNDRVTVVSSAHCRLPLRRPQRRVAESPCPERVATRPVGPASKLSHAAQ